jgi:hypothetical protein
MLAVCEGLQNDRARRKIGYILPEPLVVRGGTVASIVLAAQFRRQAA